MKIFLKNPKSHLLLKTPTEWTDNPETALGFPDTVEAIRYSVQNNLWKLRVVLHFNDGSEFVRCAVPNRWEAAAIFQIERLAGALKRQLAGVFPAGRKANPFALRIS